ncbi:hypothetical protein TNCT_170301 [Trichonephila clavata]|uniref:Uncharacterized protein n=1 Tax=Trichonephila clavata TaxID=2740835 RepID=A0A8X6LW70_TRICU|nr:hypothetical protein TNCT_170301 [Trichonephila clavata]
MCSRKYRNTSTRMLHIEMEGRMSKYSPTGMYCKVEDQKNPTYKAPHPPAKRAECVPESIETLQQNVVYRNGGRISEIFTNRILPIKAPHPPAKRAECVPESIETLQQECCIKKWMDACLKYSPTGMDCKVEDQKNPTCKKPHPPAKRAECVPESIETLQQECCI